MNVIPEPPEPMEEDLECKTEVLRPLISQFNSERYILIQNEIYAGLESTILFYAR